VEGVYGSQPRFRADGQTVLYNGTAAERNGLFLTNANGQEPRVLLDQDSAHWPAYSPDGSVIAFVDTSVNNTIFRLQGDGSRSEVKANGTPIIGAKSLLWSDDNRLVFQGCAFWAGQAGECGTFVTDANNVNPQRIIIGNSAWPSDARKGLLAYMSAEDGDWDIYVVSLNGGEPRNLSANNRQDGLPAIAPDGKSIAYLSNQSGSWAVWTVNVSTGEKKKWFDVASEAGTVDGDTWYMDRMSWTN
jgi:TolB protein